MALNYKHPQHMLSNEDDESDPIVRQLKDFRRMVARKEALRAQIEK